MSNLLLTILNLGERRHFDTLDTLEKIKILISESLGNLSFSHRGIVEEFNEERDKFVTINDISNFTNSIITVPNLGER